MRFFEEETGICANDVNVKLLGRQQPEQLVAGLLLSNLYVHPSYIDNSPNSLCEAQYLGVPIIATNGGGVSAILKDGITGRLVPANAPYDMAFAIKDCHDNEKTWAEMAEKGSEDAHQRHNPDSIIKDLLNVYRTIKYSKF